MLKTTGLFMFAALLSGSVWAQQETKKKDEPKPDVPKYEEFVVVEGRVPDVPETSVTPVKLPLDIRSIPATVDVVPRFLFEAQHGTVLGDALKNAAGVNVAPGFGVFDYFVIRGQDSLSTGLVMTDGAFEPESTMYHLYNLEQVEVLKGPVAFLYGANPLSGAVNLVRKQPVFRTFADFDFSYGQFQTARLSSDVNVAGANGMAAFRLNALYDSSNFYRDDKSNYLGALNPSLTWRIDDKTSLTTNFELVKNEYEPDTGLPLLGNQIPDVPRTRSYQSPSDVSAQDIYRFRVDLVSRVSDGLSIRNKFYYTDLKWQSDGTLLLGAFPSPGGSIVARTQLLLHDRQKLLGNQFELVSTFTTGTVTHKLLAGFEANRLGDAFTLDVGFLPNVDLFNPVEVTPGPIFIVPGQSVAADGRALTFAPYAVDHVSFGERIQVFLGARWDSIDYEEPLTRTDRSDRRLSPLVGGVYTPAKDFSIYASYGEAFAPPSTLVIGEREPEDAWQFEVGVKPRWANGKVSGGAAFYQLERENVAIPDQTGVLRQTGAVRSRGIELELAAEPSNGWLAFATYAYNDSVLTRFAELLQISQFPPAFLTLDRSGNRPAFAPQHVLNLWMQREVRPGLTVGGGARYVSGQFIAESNAFEIDSYVTVDAVVSYQMKNWRFSLNLKNLTDTEYETRGFGSSAVIPANPFAAYASVRVSLGS